jgi:DNA-directed RNA polymerase subunit RPC12/RpoP
MQTVNFKCGHCGNLMGVSAEYLGQQVRCPHCQQVVVAPAASPALETTLPLMPSAASNNFDNTALLPPPVHDAGATESFFEQPAPPRLDVPSPPEESTLAFDSRSPPVTVSPSVPVTEPPSSLEIPEWMNSTVLAPAPNGPAAELRSPPPMQAPRGGMSLGMMLFLSLVFMPLVLYSVLVTVLAILFYNHSFQGEPPVDPREFLIDSDGDHPGAKKLKTSGRQLQTDSKFATLPLPANLRLKLGETLRLGDLRVKAERVEWAEIKMIAKNSNKPEVRETLKLQLHLENVSKEAAFYPMDCFFDRKSSGKGSAVPLTVLMAGDQLRFFGGPANWNRGPVSRNDNPEPRYYVLESNYGRELKPGEEMDTFVCTDGPDPRYDSDPLQPKFDELKAYKGSFVWHIHVRRGLVRWKDHDYPATAVFGVEFTDQDVKSAN